MSAKRPILIVSYFFPPRGGAGTQRFAKFAKWLGAFGFQPIVVTADDGERSSAAPHDDATLLEELPEDVAVIRVPGDAPSPATLRERARWAAGFRADDERWARRALPFALDAARQYDVQAVITTVSPYAVAELGPAVGQRCDVPWLLDLRDPWALDGWRAYPSRWHASADLRRMQSALRRADVVIANTPEARKAYVELLGIDDGRLCTIPNGFDRDDFRSPVLDGWDDAAPDADSALVRLIHVGTLHDPMPGRRGDRRWRDRFRHTWRTIDRTARSGRSLLEALAILRRQQPALAQRLRLDLVGRVHPNHRALAAQLGVWDLIAHHGYQAHGAALAMMQRSDAVFVPLHDLPEGEPALIVPAKLYEALASGRRVIGALPAGDGRRLIEQTGAGMTCRPSDTAALAAAVAQLADGGYGGAAGAGADCAADRKLLQPFERRRLTARLAAAVEAAQSGRPACVDDPWMEVQRLADGSGRMPEPSAKRIEPAHKQPALAGCSADEPQDIDMT